MKILAIQRALAVISALFGGLLVSAQQTPAPQTPPEQKQPAQPPAAAVPAPAPAAQKPTGEPSAAPAAKPAPPPASADTSENNAAVAATERKSLLSQSDSPVVSDQKLSGEVRVAAKGINHQSAREFAGRTVRGSDRKALGKLKDFLIDPPSGEVSYAVISSGGSKLRLVPFRALKPDREHATDFTVSITNAEWKGLGALDKADFKSGYITVSDGERRALAQRFEPGRSRDAASAYYTRDISAHLTRADILRDRSVFVAGNKRIGAIREVIVSWDTATASALFDPSWRFTNAKEKFVVPLNRYTFGTTKGERVMTALTRDDFEAMRAVTHEGGPPKPPPPVSTLAATPTTSR